MIANVSHYIFLAISLLVVQFFSKVSSFDIIKDLISTHLIYIVSLLVCQLQKMTNQCIHCIFFPSIFSAISEISMKDRIYAFFLLLLFPNTEVHWACLLLHLIEVFKNGNILLRPLVVLITSLHAHVVDHIHQESMTPHTTKRKTNILGFSQVYSTFRWLNLARW